MRTGARSIRNGREYERYFPKPKGQKVVIKSVGRLSDTVQLMKQVIEATLDDTGQIAQVLKGSTPFESCKNIWYFVFNHLQYKRDESRTEQVRRPARSWFDRHKGVDCDCMTVFIGSILEHLRIPYLIRLTGYEKGFGSLDFEHVYPVALVGGREIILDAVVHQFNYQVPFQLKKDVKMELQYLNGFEDDEFSPTGQQLSLDSLLSASVFDLSPVPLPGDELYGLGKLRKNKGKLKQKLSTALNKINRVNPALALMRAGVLAAMKLNFLHLAAKLRYSYMPPAQAQKSRILPQKFIHLVKIRQRLEKTYSRLGGKPHALREAILTGRGNRDRKIALNGLEGFVPSVQDRNLRQVLGQELFDTEFSLDEQLNGLGEPVTAASIAAASTLLASIQALVKQVGDLFPKGSQENAIEQVQEIQTAAEQKQLTQEVKEEALENPPIQVPDAPLAPELTNEDNASTMNKSLSVRQTQEVSTEQPPPEKSVTSDSTEKGFFEKAGDWIKENPKTSVAIGIAAVAGIFWGASKLKKGKNNGLSGVKGQKKQTQKGKKKQGKKPPYEIRLLD